MNTRPFVLGGLCLAVAACLFPTDVCGCPPALGIATVAGVVQRADGSPAVGAVVRASLSLVQCGAAQSDLVDSPAHAAVDAGGWYRHLLRAYAPSDTACVTLTAVDTAGGRRDSAAVTGLRIRLVSSGTRERMESLRVDFRFR